MRVCVRVAIAPSLTGEGGALGLPCCVARVAVSQKLEAAGIMAVQWCRLPLTAQSHSPLLLCRS